MVNILMVLGQTSWVSQNQNFITSNIEQDVDDDEIDDSSNIILLCYNYGFIVLLEPRLFLVLQLIALSHLLILLLLLH
jgi:hypothetical protein